MVEMIFLTLPRCRVGVQVLLGQISASAGLLGLRVRANPEIDLVSTVEQHHIITHEILQRIRNM